MVFLLTVPLPTINNTCVISSPSFVNLSSGQIPLNVFPQTGLTSLGVTNFSIGGAPTNTIDQVIITGVWNSDNDATNESPSFSLEGTQLGFLPTGGGSCNENTFTFTISTLLYNTVAADGVLDFSVGADPSVGSNCSMDYIDVDLSLIHI